MTRLTFSNETFNCHLTCGRCTHIKCNGQRCKNRVCFGFPICWIHSLQVYGVRLRESTIPDTGKGLFATRDFPRYTWICPYNGEDVTEACLEQRYPGNVTAPYAVDFKNDPHRYVDSACLRSMASMANGLFRPDGTSQPLTAHNAEIVERPGSDTRHWLRARRNIFEGDEIFVYYGTVYTLDNDHETKRRRADDNRPC